MSDLILILDDELSYATMLGDLLDEHGYQTDICTQPRDALERLQHRSYGLIVSDFKMPECDGGEFIREVRRILPKVPIVMVSGLMGKSDLLTVANIGVTMVLAKPFDVPVFLECVSTFVDPRTDGELAGLAAAAVERAPLVDTASNYPQPLRFVAAESPVGKAFLNELWRRFEPALHCLLVTPPGAELELLVHECQGWIGDSAAPLHHLSYGELGCPDRRATLREIAEGADKPRVVALTVPPGMEIDREEMEDFLRWTRDEPLVRERLRFIHALPDLVEVRKIDLPADLQAIASRPLALPALAERMTDLAAYARRLLVGETGGGRRPLTSGAVEVLLHYGWPGNYHELRGALHRAQAYAAAGEITARVLRLALRDRHGAPPPEDQPLSLEAFLLREQRRFLQRHLPSKDRHEALSRLLGSRFDRIDRDLEPEDYPLLFEELLENDRART